MLFSEQVRAAASSGSSTPVLPKGIKDLNGGFHGSPRSATTNTTGLFMLTAGHKCSNVVLVVLKHRWHWKDQEDARDQTRFKGGMRRGHFVEYRCPRRCQNKEDDKTKKNKEAVVSIRPCDVVVMSSTKPRGLCSMEVVIWKTYRRNWKGGGERTITERKRREAPRSRYVAVVELMHPQAHFPNGLVQAVTYQEIQWEWTNITNARSFMYFFYALCWYSFRYGDVSPCNSLPSSMFVLLVICKITNGSSGVPTGPPLRCLSQFKLIFWRISVISRVQRIYLFFIPDAVVLFIGSQFTVIKLLECL
jgi:hypothetical protein